MQSNKKPFKIISDADASNFPVLKDVVGKRILATEYYKALDGNEFEVIDEEVEASTEDGEATEGEEVETVEEEATEGEAPKKAKAKSKATKAK